MAFVIKVIGSLLCGALITLIVDASLNSKYYYYLFRGRKDTEELLEQELKKTLAILEANENTIDEPDSEPDDLQLDDNTCVHCNGVVTTLETEYGLIDEKYYFKTNVVKFVGLKVGDRVSFVVYKLTDSETEVVKKLIKIKDDTWDLETTSNEYPEIESKHQLLKRNLVGQIIERKGRQITVSPHNYICSLDEVQSEFIPIVGDWIVLEALTEVDETVNDLTGDILNVLHIYPLRSKPMSGFIKIWDAAQQEGVIDNDTFFHKDVCEPGYMPCQGDKVVCEIIESTQGRCSWRAMTVSPLLNNTTKNAVDATLNDTMRNLTINKNGIVITDDLVFDSMKLHDVRKIKVNVENTSEEYHEIIRYCFNSQRSTSQLKLMSHNFNSMRIKLHPKQSVTFEFSCQAKFMGKTRELFVFHFRDFKIGRWFEITVDSGVLNNESYTRKNYSNLARKMCDRRGTDVFRGIRLIKPPAFVPIKMGIYSIPNRLWEAVLGKNHLSRSLEEITSNLERIIPCLHSDLNFENYNDRFQALLYLEEIQMNVNMHSYDIERGHFIVNGEFLMLEIPNLSERRPSLMIGDRVLASEPWNLDVPKYEGYIHKIMSKHIYLRFSSAFHCGYSGQEYNIEFTFMRTSLRRCHQAIGLAVKHLGKDFLFPTGVKEQSPQVQFVVDPCVDQNNQRIKGIQTSPKLTSVSRSSKNIENNSESPLSIRITSKNVTFTKIDAEKFHRTMLNAHGGLESETFSKLRNETENNASGSRKRTSKYTSTKISQSSSTNKENKLKKIIWCNKRLNYHQKEAIKNIIMGVARPLPYIIFGPPGTGKTITLVEAVLQIIRMVPGSRLLIASPSNSSADLLAIRLLDSKVLRPGDLVRLVAHRCIVEGTIPERLIPYCATGELAREGTRQPQEQLVEGVKLGCSTSVLGRHRITVATCVCLGQLYNMGFARGHFTHVLVDEAGQATEPEILIPLSLYDISTGQVVLAGDPLQLGPVVMSSLAEHYGMEESLLVRLSRRFPYERDWQGFPDSGGYDPRLITRLAINYRSVPEILTLPSSLFYDSELQPVISQSKGPEADLLTRLVTELPAREIGGPPALVFHGVRGENLQQADCPSWYNPHEATQVFYYLNRFYDLGITANEIGIITPYAKQVKEIRKLLLSQNMDLPKISSVEEFQGQERNIIILSTVRSTTSLVAADVKHSIGFIASPRRLNVALTRAQALLIIIGNPHILAADPYWRSVLVYCLTNNAYIGCDLPSQYMSVDDL